ncbi:cobalt ECF transporter T component CbiQ [Gephyromycinifex aptenodytis]|uniref:cobalt ECF transporter T component CbiQ n=1 Tax=Gephyromycinifex aptenodytis TaxID=2716227 RepID=UPI001445E95F|nr:cobalt ECF transporter T component CbiQ [Gephyromycinifex aptenodytis]
MSARGLALDTAAWASPWRTRRVLDKAILALGLLGCAVALPPWPGGVAAGVSALVILLGPGRVPARLLARCMSAPAVFVIIGAATVMVSVWWDAGPRIGLASSQSDLALQILVRGISGALCAFVLATTTPMVDLFAALRRARVPDPLIEVASLTYRLIFVLLDSARAIREAQDARLGYTSRAASYRSLSSLSAAILVRSWTRARRLEDGLAGRGYVDALRTLDPPVRASRVFIASSLVLVAAIVCLALLPGYLPAGTLPSILRGS